MKLYLIRHGKTKGNLEKRYMGRTDESLCREGIMQIQRNLAEGIYAGIDKTDFLFVSPMRRCRETAELLLPKREKIFIPAFREIDFGRFEGKNYQELAGDSSYQAWIDSNGCMTFPDGESREDFTVRCSEGMKQAVHMVSEKAVGSDMEMAERERVLTMVVHGGTIMALLSTFGKEEGDYYDYQCENGGGYVCEMRENKIQERQLFIADICSL